MNIFWCRLHQVVAESSTHYSDHDECGMVEIFTAEELIGLLTDIHDGLDSIAHGATNGKPWAAKMAQRIADKLEKKDG